MQILPASAADADAIIAIWNPVIRDTTVTFNSVVKTPADVTAMIDNRDAFLVARDEDLLGFATYSQFRAGVGYAHTMEHTVILSPTARRKGVGRALMSALETHARGNGVHSMIASISEENPAAVAFHTGIGYTEVGRIPEVGRKFDRWIASVLMQKILWLNQSQP